MLVRTIRAVRAGTSTQAGRSKGLASLLQSFWPALMTTALPATKRGLARGRDAASLAGCLISKDPLSSLAHYSYRLKPPIL